MKMSLYFIWASQVVLVEYNPTVSAGDTRGMGLIPGLGWSPWVEKGNPFQYSGLEEPMYKGAWWATVHGVTWCWRWVKWLTHMHFILFRRDSLCSNITFFPRFHHLLEQTIKPELWSSVHLRLLEATCWEIPSQGPLIVYVTEFTSQPEHMNRMLGLFFTAY